MLAIEYHVHIWQVLPQLSCGDTCQIWMWFKQCNRYFCEIENFAYGEIDERSYSNPTPWCLLWVQVRLVRCCCRYRTIWFIVWEDRVQTWLYAISDLHSLSHHREMTWHHCPHCWPLQRGIHWSQRSEMLSISVYVIVYLEKLWENTRVAVGWDNITLMCHGSACYASIYAIKLVWYFK